jgi:hypothetical protein
MQETPQAVDDFLRASEKNSDMSERQQLHKKKSGMNE